MKFTMDFRVAPEKSNFKKQTTLIMSEEECFVRKGGDECVKCMHGHAGWIKKNPQTAETLLPRRLI